MAGLVKCNRGNVNRIMADLVSQLVIHLRRLTMSLLEMIIIMMMMMMMMVVMMVFDCVQ